MPKASTSDDECNINLWDLAFKGRRYPAAPTDEAAPFMDGQLEQAPAAELTSQIIPTVDEEYQPSEYELQRLERIRNNQEYLASLGLEPLQAATANKKRKWVKQRPVEKRPSSSRLQGKDKPNYKTKPTRSPSEKKQPSRISSDRKYNLLEPNRKHTEARTAFSIVPSQHAISEANRAAQKADNEVAQISPKADNDVDSHVMQIQNESVPQDMREIKTEISQMKSNITELREEIIDKYSKLKSEMVELKLAIGIELNSFKVELHVFKSSCQSDMAEIKRMLGQFGAI